MLQQQIVLQIAADVRAVDPQRILAVCSFDMVRLREGLSQVSTHQILVSDLCSEGGAPCYPVKIAAEVHTVNVRTVVVVFHLLGLIPITLISIVVLIPIDAGHQSEFAAVGLCLNG